MNDKHDLADVLASMELDLDDKGDVVIHFHFFNHQRGLFVGCMPERLGWDKADGVLIVRDFKKRQYAAFKGMIVDTVDKTDWAALGKPQTNAVIHNLGSRGFIFYEAEPLGFIAIDQLNLLLVELGCNPVDVEYKIKQLGAFPR